VEKAEVEKAATRLGVEEKSPLRRIMKGVGIAAIVFIVFIFIFSFIYSLLERSRDTGPGLYPYMRSPYVPGNRFLALMLLNISASVEYGVFSRGKLLGEM
jgi:hypothetical protein